MKKSFLFLFLFLFVVGAGYFTTGYFTNSSEAKAEITVYKSPTCGCCVGHIGELKKNGYDVKVVEVEDLNAIKSQYNIPRNMQSCHTSVMNGYFIEGHVPISVIDNLLEDNPNIEGISLPGMPAGSPGMPGYKQGDFVIQALKNGEWFEFTRV